MSTKLKLSRPRVQLSDARMHGLVATDARGGVIPRCWHWMGEENAQMVAEDLLRFFATERAEMSVPTAGASLSATLAG